MDFHHVMETAGVVTLCLVFYSYTWRWLETPTRRRWRPAVNGLVFGVLAVVLMASHVQLGEGLFVDARAAPVALVALFEGWPAGALAATVATVYRVWQGGDGAPAGVMGLALTAVIAALVHGWARREGGIRLRHSLVLGVAVFVITAGSFAVVGRRGVTMLSDVWLVLLVASVVGVGLVGRLFSDVVTSRQAEEARRNAAQLRAVALLARAAAHEINNPLTAVMGGITRAARRLPAGAPEKEWLAQAAEASERIREIVQRMGRVTAIQELPSEGSLPPMLDLTKSSGPP